MRKLKRSDPSRAVNVERRAKDWIERNRHTYPGSNTTGILNKDKAAEVAFDNFANDEPCPALDPEAQTCDLYAHRPMTCRVFGPPIRTEQGLGVCELCFKGAPKSEITRCELRPDPDDLETRLLEALDSPKRNEETVVAFALLTPTPVDSSPKLP